VPLPSAEVPLDRFAAHAVVRQLARRLGHMPSVEDYEEWAASRRGHRPGLVTAGELLETAGASSWDELVERVARG
jgi:hypothetical protein